MVVVGLVRLDGFQPVVAAGLPLVHRSAVQQVHTFGRPVAKVQRDSTDATLRLYGAGAICDGWQQTKRPRQCIFHWIWGCQAGCLLRHSAGKTFGC